MLEIPAAIAERIRADAGEQERRGAIAPETLAYMYEAGLFKLFVPAELGGHALPLPEALRVFEQASGIDGSFGWLVTIGSGGGFFAATFTAEQAVRWFADPKAVVAGSGHPNGIARPAPGGYVVSGRWSYCSGASYASLFTANCRIVGEGAAATFGAEQPVGGAVLGTEQAVDGVAFGAEQAVDGAAFGAEQAAGEAVFMAEQPAVGVGDAGSAPEAGTIRSFVFAPDQVNVIRDWNALGLKATESNTIEVRSAFVPYGRTFDILSEPRYADPIYRFPFMAFAQTSFAAVCLGLGDRFLDETRQFADGKRALWAAARPERLQALDCAAASGQLSFAAAHGRFYETVERLWATFVRSGALTEAEMREIADRSREAAQTALANAQAVFPHLGMDGLQERHPLNRIWRDIHTVTQHSALARV